MIHDRTWLDSTIYYSYCSYRWRYTLSGRPPVHRPHHGSLNSNLNPFFVDPRLNFNGLNSDSRGFTPFSHCTFNVSFLIHVLQAEERTGAQIHCPLIINSLPQLATQAKRKEKKIKEKALRG